MLSTQGRAAERQRAASLSECVVVRFKGALLRAAGRRGFQRQSLWRVFAYFLLARKYGPAPARGAKWRLEESFF
ncbi:MAG TPA: hypothetical protein DC013_11400 [Ruminococcaceae bacterium]|nr:hypothetical protein [Oscillospiraceae bacterium]